MSIRFKNGLQYPDGEYLHSGLVFLCLVQLSDSLHKVFLDHSVPIFTNSKHAGLKKGK